MSFHSHINVKRGYMISGVVPWGPGRPGLSKYFKKVKIFCLKSIFHKFCSRVYPLSASGVEGTRPTEFGQKDAYTNPHFYGPNISFCIFSLETRFLPNFLARHARSIAFAFYKISVILTINGRKHNYTMKEIKYKNIHIANHYCQLLKCA